MVMDWDFELFFFFQAEDGIRDLTVTGVQTCALPILTRTAARRDFRPVATGINVAVDVTSALRHVRSENVVARIPGSDPALTREAVLRSEERRVGKECRSRWSPYH